MRTSAPGSDGREDRRLRQSGLTLVEVLAVIGLVSLLTAVVIMTAPGRASEAEGAARRFALDVTALSDRAVTSGRTLGLDATEGLAVQTYSDRWETERRIALPDAVSAELTPEGEILPPDPVPKGTLVIYQPPGGETEEAELPPPAVLFGPTGEVTPFAAVFDDGEEAWRVTVGPFGETEVADVR